MFFIKAIFLIVLLSLCTHANISLPMAHMGNMLISSRDVQRHPERLAFRQGNFGMSNLGKGSGQGNTVVLGGGWEVAIGTYVANITVGTQEFTVIIDTGSSNFLLAGEGCDDCYTSNLYNPQDAVNVPCDSSFCKACTPAGYGNDTCVFDSPCTGTGSYGGSCSFGVTYGGGSSAFEGYYVHDMVTFGDYTFNATVGVGEHEFPGGSFSGGGLDGILGMASEFNACNPTCVPTTLNALVRATGIDDLFAMAITGTNGGFLDLGYVNSTRYQGDVVYVDMEMDRWYTLQVEDVKVGNTSLGLSPFVYRTTNDEIGTFVDSGTSLVALNPMITAALQGVFAETYGNLPAVNTLIQNFTCVPSSQVPDPSVYPDITVVVDQGNGEHVHLVLPSTSYLFSPSAESIVNDSQGIYASSGGYVCPAFFTTTGIGMVLGDPFLENYYVVYDRGNRQVGFATLA